MLSTLLKCEKSDRFWDLLLGTHWLDFSHQKFKAILSRSEDTSLISGSRHDCKCKTNKK